MLHDATLCIRRVVYERPGERKSIGEIKSTLHADLSPYQAVQNMQFILTSSIIRTRKSFKQKIVQFYFIDQRNGVSLHPSRWMRPTRWLNHRKRPPHSRVIMNAIIETKSRHTAVCLALSVCAEIDRVYVYIYA